MAHEMTHAVLLMANGQTDKPQIPFFVSNAPGPTSSLTGFDAGNAVEHQLLGEELGISWIPIPFLFLIVRSGQSKIVYLRDRIRTNTVIYGGKKDRLLSSYTTSVLLRFYAYAIVFPRIWSQIYTTVILDHLIQQNTVVYGVHNCRPGKFGRCTSRIKE